MGFENGKDCLQQLCPPLINDLGGDWPYLDIMDQLRSFCTAIDRWLSDAISIYLNSTVDIEECLDSIRNLEW